MNKSLTILFINIKKGINRHFFPNLNANSVNFPVTGEVML